MTWPASPGPSKLCYLPGKEFGLEIMSEVSSGTSYGWMHPGSGEAPCIVVWLLVPARWGGAGLRLGTTPARIVGWCVWR